MIKMEIATFGAGCFWCIEAIIQQLKGVEKVESGYSGGTVPGIPTYREVCSGKTGHAEVIQVTFDSEVLCYHDLITIFMTSHNATLLNKQGADRGTQYRSVIYFHSDEQREVAELVFSEIKGYYSKPIVTELAEATAFYSAEAAHQNYYRKHPKGGYCQVVIDPKISKLRAMYANKLK